MTLKDCLNLQLVRHILCLKNKFYNQIDGVVMGSPLAPVLATINICAKKELAFSLFEHTPNFLQTPR